MSREVAPGSTDVFEYINVPAGATLTDLDYQYVRSGGTPSVKVDATAGTVGAHADNTAVYVDATDSPELLQVCFPDAAYAAGAEEVILSVYNPTEGWQRDLRVKLKHSYDGAVWWDSAASNANTRYGVDGTRERPIDDTAALLSLLSSSGFNRVKVKGSLLLDVDLSGVTLENWDGTGVVTFTGGNNVSNCIFIKLRVGNGIMIGNSDTKFFDCDLINILAGGVNGFNGKAVRCSLNDTIGFADTGTSDFMDCYQAKGSSVLMAVNDTSQAIGLFNFAGELTFNDSGATNIANIYSNGQTKVTLGSLLNGGSYIFHGVGNVVDNKGVGTTIDLTDWVEVDNLAAELALIQAIKAQTDKFIFNGNDYVRSALSNVETTAVDQITVNIGKYFNAIKTGTTQSGGHTLTSINSNANFDEADAVIGSLIVFQHNAGDNAFAARVITANGQTNGVIEFSPALPQIPPDGIQFIVVPAGFNIDGATLTNQVDILSRIGTPADLGSGPDLSGNTVDIQSRLDFLRNGTAQAGAAGSITLDAGASAVDDFYNQLVVGIISGTGAGQAKRIAGYNGTTKVATVDSNWATTPDATSVFTLFPFAEVPVDINAIRDAILSDSTPFNGADIPAIKAKTDNLPADPASETTLAVIIAAIAALNDISPAEVLAEVDSALDAPNSALGGVPNVETGSLRQMIQIVAYVAKLGKIETSSLQTLLNEAGASFATRAITPNPPTDVTLGELT